MEKATEFRIVFVTTKTFDNARQISRILVAEHLAACCSIIHNVSSVFGWQGVINEQAEYIMIIKTSKERLDAIEKRIIELHTYEVPEIISVTLESASGPYLDWLKQSIALNH